MKHKKALTLSGIIFLILFMFAGCGERSGEKEFAKAIAARDDGDLVRARTLMDKAIRKMSGNGKKSVAWNELGLILWNLHETEAAAEAFSTACNLSETMSSADLNMGVTLFHCGRYDEAEVVLNNVLGNSPDNATALAMLGVIEMQKPNWTGSAKAITQAINIDRNNPATQNALALAELHLGNNSDAAINRLKLVIGAQPNYAPAAYNLAVIYDQWLGNKSAAIGWYQQYLEKAGENGAQVAQARKTIQRLGGRLPENTSPPASVNDPKSAERFMVEGARLQEAGKFSEAIQQYQQAIQADARLVGAHYNMGLAYYSLGRYEDTIKCCLNALAIDARLADARYMLSLSYYQLKRWNDAEREAKALQKLAPKRGEEMLTYISNARK